MDSGAACALGVVGMAQHPAQPQPLLAWFRRCRRPCRPRSPGLARGTPHPGWMKLSRTILRPALSKSTVSLLPSTLATVPGPNLVWKTRMPPEKAEGLPVDLTISSPSIWRGPPERCPPRPPAPDPKERAEAAVLACARCQPGVA